MPKNKQAIQKMALEYAKTNYSGTKESKYVMAVSRYSYEGGYTAAVEDMEKFSIGFCAWVALNFVPTIASMELKYWQKGTYQNKDKLYSTADLLTLYRESIKTTQTKD